MVAHRVGPDPPDFVLDFEGSSVGLEVTQLTPLSFDSAGEAKNRVTEDEHASRLVEEMRAAIGDCVPSHLSIVLDVRGPVWSPRKFRRLLRAEIEAFIASSTTSPSSVREIEIVGNTVGIRAVPAFEPPGRRIVGVISNEDANLFVIGEATQSLSLRIRAKAERMNRSNWSEVTWLALVVAHPMIGAREFVEAYRRLNVNHPFDRIYLIDRGGSLTELGRAV